MKTPRANRRRRTPRRRQRGGATDKQMGFHLGSDVLHDFGALYKLKKVQYHTDPVQNITQDEPIVVDYFSDKGDIGNRKDASITFTVPKNTSVFGSWTPPNLTGVENGSVGIVYDAGDKITKQLGARNVITFGSVLDPSKKPVLGPDDPIWFDVGAGTSVNIPLTMFGFDSKKITSLEITKFIGQSTCAIFHTPTEHIDAIRGPSAVAHAGGCTSKPINESRASKVGYFVSIKEAKDNVAKLLVNDNPVDDQRAMFYLAGKTLGDTMLVASCMDKFGDMPNPFHLTNVRRQIGEAGAVEGGVWKKLSGGAIGGLGPSTLILKTQDRLNHTRALIMNVPSILQSKFEYTFVPGSIEDTKKVELYNLGYARLRTGLANRYDELIRALDEDVRRKVSGSKITTGGVTFNFKQVFKQALAGNCIDQIISSLTAIRNTIIREYDAEDKNPEGSSASEIKQVYEGIYKRYNKLAPATTSIFDETEAMERHIVVCLGSNKSRIQKKLMIDFMTDFRDIAKLSEAPGDVEWQIKGDALKMVVNTAKALDGVAAGQGEGAPDSDAPMSGIPPGQGDGAVSNAAATSVGAAGEDQMADVGEAAPVSNFDMTAHFKKLEGMFLGKIGSPPIDAAEGQGEGAASNAVAAPVAVGRDEGLLDIDQKYVNEFSDISSNQPPIGGALETPYIIRDNAGTLLNDFIKYASPHGVMREDMFVRGAKTIDNMLWNELVKDYEHAAHIDPPRPAGDSIPNQTTILFNAFVCHINATNSTIDSDDFDMKYADLAIAVDDEDYAKEMDETTEIAEQILKRLGLAPAAVAAAPAAVVSATRKPQRVLGKIPGLGEVNSDSGEETMPVGQRWGEMTDVDGNVQNRKLSLLEVEQARAAAAAAAAEAEAQTRAEVEEAWRKLADLVKKFERAKKNKKAVEGGYTAAGLERLFEEIQAAYGEYMKKSGRNETRILDPNSKTYNDLVERVEIRSGRGGGTRRKKRAGTYRKKRKDKGTL
jgi:hypothetical protein